MARLSYPYMPTHIYIDADACPVREETYKVARRHSVPVTVVANNFIRVPKEPGFSFHLVNDNFDAADDYIAEAADKDPSSLPLIFYWPSVC